MGDWVGDAARRGSPGGGTLPRFTTVVAVWAQRQGGGSWGRLLNPRSYHQRRWSRPPPDIRIKAGGKDDVFRAGAWRAKGMPNRTKSALSHRNSLKTRAEELTLQLWDERPRKAYWQGWPLSGMWKLGFQEGSPHSLIRGEHGASAFCTNTIAAAGHLLSFWWSGGMVPARQWCPGDPPPVKILGPQAWMSFSDRQQFTPLVTTHCWRGEGHPVWFPGSGLSLACAWFPQTAPHVPFSFAEFALCPFAVINLSNDYDSTLSPVEFS